jgi:hypothetical protein
VTGLLRSMVRPGLLGSGKLHRRRLPPQLRAVEHVDGMISLEALQAHGDAEMRPDSTSTPANAIAPKSVERRSPARDRGQTTDAATLPVTVIIPTYNRAEMLRRALASVWSQRPALPGEVIVVDDGSEDQTSSVASEMGATVIRHAQNRGLSAARNTGLRAARHAWVALLDSDDEWLPHHLSTVWSMRGHHVLISSSAISCGEDPAGDRFAGPLTRSPLVLHSADQLVYPSNIVPVSTSLFRGQLALDVGGFRAHHGVAEDFDMWLRLLERGTAICSPRVTTIYYRHAGQMSAQNLRTMQLGHEAAAAAHMRRARGSSIPLRRFQTVAAWDNLREALDARERRAACRWGAYIVARPLRMPSLVRALRGRHRVRRRSAALRRSGIRRDA